MRTYTIAAGHARPMPLNGRNAVSRVHLLLSAAGVELPGNRFNVTHFANPGTHGRVVISTPVTRKERAVHWFAALAPLLPWACTMELDEQRGTVTITDPKE